MLLAQYVEARFHFVVVKTLARIAVKLDFQSVVNLADCGHRNFFEHVEICGRFLVAVLDTLEPSARLVVHFGMLFRFLVIAHVKFVEEIFVVLGNLFERRPFARCDNEFAELSAPVAKVIYAHDLVAEMFEYTIKRAADDGCA